MVAVLTMNSSSAVADYLLGILFPAEGAANLREYRDLAIKFLDTANDGTTASPLSSRSSTTTSTASSATTSSAVDDDRLTLHGLWTDTGEGGLEQFDPTRGFKFSTHEGGISVPFISM